MVGTRDSEERQQQQHKGQENTWKLHLRKQTRLQTVLITCVWSLHLCKEGCWQRVTAEGTASTGFLSNVCAVGKAQWRRMNQPGEERGEEGRSKAWMRTVDWLVLETGKRTMWFKCDGKGRWFISLIWLGKPGYPINWLQYASSLHGLPCDVAQPVGVIRTLTPNYPDAEPGKYVWSMRLTGFYPFQIWVSGFLWDMWTTLSMEVKTSLDVPRFFTQVSNPGRVSIYLLHKLKFTKLHPDQPRVGHMGSFWRCPLCSTVSRNLLVIFGAH